MNNEARDLERAQKLVQCFTRWPGSNAAGQIASALSAVREEARAQALEVVAYARAHYGTDIFEADGITLEACQARWARNLLDGIADDIRSLLEGSKPAAAAPKAEEGEP